MNIQQIAANAVTKCIRERLPYSDIIKRFKLTVSTWGETSVNGNAPYWKHTISKWGKEGEVMATEETADFQ